MTNEEEKRSGWLRLASVGTELAAAVVGLTLLGYAVDRHYGTTPWGVVTGALLGIVGGMYNFLRAALAESRRAAEEAAEMKERGEPDDRERS